MTKLSNNAHLLILWILGTTFGPFVGLTFLLGYLAYDSYKWTTIVPVSLVIIGILLGIGQWIILRTHLKNMWAWIPLTAIGFLLGLFLGLYLGDRFDSGYWNPSMPIAVGTVLGITQWPVIAKQVTRSILWIPMSIISWTIGLGITLVVFDHFTTNYILVNYSLEFGAGLGLLCGILVGSISGIFLISHIRMSRDKKIAGDKPANPT